MNERAKGHRTQRRKQGHNHREDAQTRQILAELERQIKTVQAGGDHLSALAGRQAKALLYYTDQKWTAAAREYDQAAQLAAAEEQPLSEAQSRLGQGLALENLLHRQEDAQAAFRQAADLYLELGKLDSMLEARQHIAALYAKAGDFGQAVEEMTDTLEHLDQATHPHLVIAAYRSRAQFRALQVNMAGEGAKLALADLDEALRVAEESGDRETALEIRTQRRAGQGLLDGEGQVEDLSALLQDSLDIGRLDTLGEVHLQRAQEFSQQGQFEKVLEAAEAAR